MPPSGPTATQKSFVALVMSTAQLYDGALSYNTRLLLAAWGALESSWGGTPQAKKGFNFWNEQGPGWDGPTLPGNDLEYVVGSSKARSIIQGWHVYPDLKTAIRFVLAHLKNSAHANYREAYAQLLDGEPGFVSSLGVLERGADGKVKRADNRPSTAGYYTLPRSEYQAAMAKLVNVVALAAQELGLSGVAACLPPPR